MNPYAQVRIADAEGKRFFGPGPFELLGRVGQTGSLHAAAKQMGMAYSKAVRLISQAEEGFGCRLLDRQVGGVRGGGSHLTPAAQELCARYEAWSRESVDIATSLFQACFAGMGNVASLGCVVMASGQAKRFGRQKLLEPLAGIPVLQRTLEAVKKSGFEAVVSSRWEEVRELASTLGFDVAAPEGGQQSDTIRAGIEALGPRAGYLFLQGDQPLVLPESLDALASAFARNPTKVVRLAWQGRAASPILFPGKLKSALESLAGDIGGSALLRERPEIAHEAVLVEARSGIELLDIDTPADLERMSKLIDDLQSGRLVLGQGERQ